MAASSPLRLLASILVALAFSVAVAPAAAHAQDGYGDPTGGVEPWEDTSGGEDYWADDDAYQDSGEPWSGGQGDWDAGAGGSAAGTLPPTPAPRPAPAPHPVPTPRPAPAPVAPAPVAPAPEISQLPIVTGSTVAGRVARMRSDGKAAVPRGAPKRIRRLIAALNEIVGKPYKWGGGHAKLIDRGYDCSGAVGYGLIRTGMLRSPMVSGGMAKAFAPGAGKWMTIYANKGHVYMEVAGLRFDTSPIGDAARNNGVRWRPVIGRRSGFAARHVTGL